MALLTKSLILLFMCMAAAEIAAIAATGEGGRGKIEPRGY